MWHTSQLDICKFAAPMSQNHILFLFNLRTYNFMEILVRHQHTAFPNKKRNQLIEMDMVLLWHGATSLTSMDQQLRPKGSLLNQHSWPHTDCCDLLMLSALHQLSLPLSKQIFHCGKPSKGLSPSPHHLLSPVIFHRKHQAGLVPSDHTVERGTTEYGGLVQPSGASAF